MAGCAICFPEDTESAWRARSGLERAAEIADESHFMVSILRCRACGQAFASVFCETIDWAEGNDPQDSFLIPVSAAESEALVRAGEDGVERALLALAPARRYLHRMYPRVAEHPGMHWIDGPVFVPYHD